MSGDIGDKIAQFVSITDCSPQKAESYLKVSDYDLSNAVQLFFDTGGADMESTPSSPPPPLPARQAPGASNEPIQIDDGDDIENDDVREAMRASGQYVPSPPARGDYEDDETMARRLQEEFYGSGGGAASGMDNEVRAPIARTRETLVGGDEDDYAYPVRGGRAVPTMRAGIFSQRTNVWANQDPDALTPEERSQRFSEATGGASARTSHAGKLAELFRPPTEIISHLTFEDARDEAKEEEKWILVNIQDESFSSQILNRDIWRDKEVQQSVRQNFIFLQMNRNGVDGRDYTRLYIPNADLMTSTFPHIAIIDPRTGEQVKVWVDMPATPMELVHTLHEFLERYSLKVDAKNPVQRQVKPKPKVDVERMTEEEMFQLAMENSLSAAEASDSSRGHDPDELTRVEADLMDFKDTVPEPKGKEVAEKTPFEKISGDNHHVEPPTGPNTTRIQFKLYDGSRVVRRFLLEDHVERLFEYVKADLLPAKMGENESGAHHEFNLVSMGKRLIDLLDRTVDEAGLKMGTVMVETVDEN